VTIVLKHSSLQRKKVSSLHCPDCGSISSGENDGCTRALDLPIALLIGNGYLREIVDFQGRSDRKITGGGANIGRHRRSRGDFSLDEVEQIAIPEKSRTVTLLYN